MKRHRSFLGWVVLLAVIGLVAFLWGETKRQKIDPGHGLIDTIKAVGDGVARRMGRD